MPAAADGHSEILLRRCPRASRWSSLQARSVRGDIAGGRRPSGHDRAGTRQRGSAGNDFAKQVTAIANDPNGSAVIEAAAFEDGKRKVRAVFKFKSKEAQRAVDKIEHRPAQRLRAR